MRIIKIFPNIPPCISLENVGRCSLGDPSQAAGLQDQWQPSTRSPEPPQQPIRANLLSSSYSVCNIWSAHTVQPIPEPVQPPDAGSDQRQPSISVFHLFSCNTIPSLPSLGETQQVCSALPSCNQLEIIILSISCLKSRP